MKPWMLFPLCLVLGHACADNAEAKIYATHNHTEMGRVLFEDSPHGLLIRPAIRALTPGLHGFHIHANASCGEHGASAGGHLDPKKNGKHLGPYANGHLGDLPTLYVDKAGEANQVNLAPRLSVKQIRGHSVMVHAGEDNYSDKPKPLGGGGERIACGVIQ